MTEQLDRILRSAGEARRAGNYAASYELGEQAWALLPEPKIEWDFYPQIMSRGQIEASSLLKDPERVKFWITQMQACYHDPELKNHYVLITAGIAYHDMGEAESACFYFDRILELFGKRGFLGEHKQYLEYLNRFKKAGGP